MNKIVFLLCFFLSVPALICASYSETESESKIVVDTKIGINYVTHIYTLAGLGFDDVEYENSYGNSLSKEDILILQKHRSQLSFSKGDGGFLSYLSFFMPAANDFKTKDEYLRYKSDLIQSIEKKSCVGFDNYIGNVSCSASEICWDCLSPLKNDIEEILTVFADNVEYYVENIYPLVRKSLDDRKNYLNMKLSGQHLIQRWEKMTGYSWPYGDDVFLLFRAGKDGPLFNDLTKNINSLYYKMDDDFVMAMFSHEFGIFLMRDSLQPLISEFAVKYPAYQSEYTLGRVNWMAFEMLSVFFNSMIEGEKSFEYYIYGDSDPVAFMHIFEELYRSGVTNPADLYRQGVLEYMKPGGCWLSGQKERKEIYEKEYAEKFGN